MRRPSWFFSPFFHRWLPPRKTGQVPDSRHTPHAPLHGHNTLQDPIRHVYAGIDTKGLEKAVIDYVEDKIKDFAKGDADALDILIPGSDFIDDIEDTLCMEGLKLAFD